MNTSFDQASLWPKRADSDGAAYVRSTMDWQARCSRRLVGLNPDLTAEQALDLAQDLSLDDALRVKAPELVAEDLYRVESPADEDNDQ